MALIIMFWMACASRARVHQHRQLVLGAGVADADARPGRLRPRHGHGLGDDVVEEALAELDVPRLPVLQQVLHQQIEARDPLPQRVEHLRGVFVALADGS